MPCFPIFLSLCIPLTQSPSCKFLLITGLTKHIGWDGGNMYFTTVCVCICVCVFVCLLTHVASIIMWSNIYWAMLCESPYSMCVAVCCFTQYVCDSPQQDALGPQWPLQVTGSITEKLCLQSCRGGTFYITYRNLLHFQYAVIKAGKKKILLKQKWLKYVQSAYQTKVSPCSWRFLVSQLRTAQ